VKLGPDFRQKCDKTDYGAAVIKLESKCPENYKYIRSCASKEAAKRSVSLNKKKKKKKKRKEGKRRGGKETESKKKEK